MTWREQAAAMAEIAFNFKHRNLAGEAPPGHPEIHQAYGAEQIRRMQLEQENVILTTELNKVKSDLLFYKTRCELFESYPHM